jgi:hypothetical protein
VVRAGSMPTVIGCAAIVVLAFLLPMAGCSTGAPPQASPSHSSALRTVKPSTPQDAARLRAFATNQEQPWGNQPMNVTWAHVSPNQLPLNLVPSVTLGRGLLDALAIDDHSSPPATTGSVAAAQLLFEHGLYISAATRNAFGQPVADTSTWAEHVARELANARHDQRSASVNGLPALVGFANSSRFGGGGTATFVRWIAGGWSITVELHGKDVAGALSVARSLGGNKVSLQVSLSTASPGTRSALTDADVHRVLAVLRTDPSVRTLDQGQPLRVAFLTPTVSPSGVLAGAVCDVFWSRRVDYLGPTPGILWDPSGKHRPPYQLFTYDTRARGLKGAMVWVLFSPAMVVDIASLPDTKAGSLLKTEPPGFRPKYPLPSPD